VENPLPHTEKTRLIGRPSLVRRRSSLNDGDLISLATNTPYVPKYKRHNLSGTSLSVTPSARDVKDTADAETAEITGITNAGNVEDSREGFESLGYFDLPVRT